MKKINFVLIYFLLLVVYSHVYSETWRLDSRFARIDIVELVHKNYPSLGNQAERISHYSGYYSVNPFLLIETLLLTKEDAAIVAHSISLKIKNNRVVSSSPAAVKAKKLMTDYDLIGIAKSASSHEMPALDLPFDHTKEWFFNGVHTFSGDDDNDDPMSSIDLTFRWSLVWGDNTSNDWVVASHDGVVTWLSSCFILITHESGWATGYYHLDNIQVETGDIVKAGDKVANYANSLEQATCQGGTSTGPHLHFTLLKDGEQASLKDVSLSKWKIHPGNFSYDSSRSSMWLIKDEVKKFAYASPLFHLNGDNEIDYRYNGMYSSQTINGHGINISITPIESHDGIRNVVFVAFYTYDDNGNANFYVGNVDFDNWRIDESKIINMKQTSGGDFSNLSVVDFDSEVVDAGILGLHFLNCAEVEVNFSLTEPVTGQVITKQLNLSKIIGNPSHVCEAPSILLTR